MAQGGTACDVSVEEMDVFRHRIDGEEGAVGTPEQEADSFRAIGLIDMRDYFVFCISK